MSPPPTWTDEQIRRLGELWTQGVSAGEIGKRIGLSRSAVLGKLSRLGLLGMLRPTLPRPEPDRSAKPRSRDSNPADGTGPRRRRGPALLREVATGAEARLWTTRLSGECAWPVAGHGPDVLACCAPVGHDRQAWAYCPAHRGLMFIAAKPVDVEALVRRAR